MNELPKYSQYCEVCKKYKECGPQTKSCDKFDPSVKITSKHSK